ncbi:TonB-dependent receptor [Sphingomonas jatrophae]|uniref:Iron complex outermembrane recepter protein n=1 Tax=Sphingomonas jatrophae TaxID=1166337 RepID=A0A1I6M9Z5_9SPHN|nr:TonB-dependent receptor [Sphingomonas jatrophae]SFS12535.1 iron complex outermembrane recepter protein [Sphingomonas jatrophae]
MRLLNRVRLIRVLMLPLGTVSVPLAAQAVDSSGEATTASLRTQQALPGDPTAPITVYGRSGPGLPPDETRHALDPRQIDLIAAGSADEIVRRLPSVHVPVNSRGEAIAFVRSAAERQVAIFYDGAAINVPWDNRLDLSLLPAALIGSARTAAAPLAPLYGVNALGAVSFSPRAPDGIAARALVGSGRAREAQGIAPLLTGTTRLDIGGSYADRRGEPLSDDAALPFSQIGDDRRTNTDRELASVFARLGSEAGGHRLSLTAFHVWGEKGIAPESDRPSGARFWRYPDIQHTLISANGGLALGDATALDLVGWVQRFRQTIDSYTDVTYDRRDTREVDHDLTFGTRALLTQQLGGARLTGSINLLDSVHKQQDITFTAGRPPAALPGFIRYHQRNLSVGADLDLPLGGGLTAQLGAGYDKVDYLDTGDKPAIADADGWTGRVGLAWDVGSGVRLRGAAGRKIRAPTMRELFGQALNRFLINPDLKPERIISAEAGAEWRGDAGGLFLVGFIQDLDGTIDQRNVGRLRQRINLAGSKVHGVEAGGDWRVAPEISIGGSATLSRVRRKENPAGQINRLAEKPSALARAYVDYAGQSGFGALAEVQHIGRAYSADVNGVLVPLPRSTALNLRASQRIAAGATRFELFARVDNVTDTDIVPQLGLPAPGRAFRIGLSVGAP